MGQVVHISVARCIPDIESQIMSPILFVLHVDNFSEVLHDVGSENLSASHGTALNESIDDGSFTHIRVAHKDHF